MTTVGLSIKCLSPDFGGVVQSAVLGMSVCWSVCADKDKLDEKRAHKLDEKRAHKLAVKEERRERRKNKVPKHVKKRKEKVAKLKHSK